MRNSTFGTSVRAQVCFGSSIMGTSSSAIQSLSTHVRLFGWVFDTWLVTRFVQQYTRADLITAGVIFTASALLPQSLPPPKGQQTLRWRRTRGTPPAAARCCCRGLGRTPWPPPRGTCRDSTTQSSCFQILDLRSCAVRTSVGIVEGLTEQKGKKKQTNKEDRKKEGQPTGKRKSGKKGISEPLQGASERMK
jgi:hypothetical protein